MGSVLRTAAVLVAAFLGLAQSMPAQQPPAAGPQGSPQQPPSSGSAGKATPDQEDALDNPVLEHADEERNITYMRSHVEFEYNHDALEGGSSEDGIRIHWLQAFGPSNRVAAGIELPFLHFNGGAGESNANGFGDFKLELRGMLGKSERFEHAAGIEITLPSASNDLLGEGQSVLRLVWGFSAQVTAHTLFSGELGYNKAIHNERDLPGMNNIEPKLILSQAFAKRFGGYLDWDSYYDFNFNQYAQTLKIGLEFELDHQEKWGWSPYVTFPLNHFTRIVEVKNTVGCDLSYNF